MTSFARRFSCLVCLPFACVAVAFARDEKRPDYTVDIHPIFAAHCLKCHGAKESQSGLRLDSFDAMRKGGDRGSAIVPGHADKSLLFLAITGKATDLARMPAESPPLPAAKAELIRRWIDTGAVGPAENDKQGLAREQHWSFRPIRRPPVPSVARHEGVANPIDAFILRRLQTEQLTPSSEADRATLIRRLSLDLRGLPPTPDEVETFRHDADPLAYERLVDRMLASPAYGERWGRHWLDQARYADSNGFTVDSPRSIWKYRDWVIAAINADLPFDRFAIEQLAGDLLPEHRVDELVATGFHRNTLVNEEGGTDKEQFRVESVIDRVNTTGSVFLGLTVGCAQCHHHKFDPISQRDYYNLFAIFNNCDEPTFSVPTARPGTAVEGARAADCRSGKAARRVIDRRLASVAARVGEADRGAARRAVDSPRSGGCPHREGDRPQRRSATIRWSSISAFPPTTPITSKSTCPQDEITAIRLETLTHPSLPLIGPGRSDATGNFVLSEFELRARPLATSVGSRAGSTPGSSVPGGQ